MAHERTIETYLEKLRILLDQKFVHLYFRENMDRCCDFKIFFPKNMTFLLKLLPVFA
jgi:hypothetical protein